MINATSLPSLCSGDSMTEREIKKMLQVDIVYYYLLFRQISCYMYNFKELCNSRALYPCLFFFCLLITIEININYCYHKWYYCIFFYLNLFYFYIYTLYHTRFVSPALYIAEQCQLSVFLQSKQVKRTPQDSINELTIWKMNLLVVPVTGFKFKSELLHA